MVLARCRYSVFRKRMQFVWCERHMMPALHILIRPDGIRTAKKSWAKRLRESGNTYGLRRKQARQMQKLFGKIWRRLYTICARMLSMFISFITRRFAQSRKTAAVCMKRCWRQKRRGKFDISGLPITDWQLHRKRSNPVCMKHCSFLSAI